MLHQVQIYVLHSRKHLLHVLIFFRWFCVLR